MTACDSSPILPCSRVTNSQYKRHSMPAGPDSNWSEPNVSKTEAQADTRNVMIVDPHRLVRQSLKLVLQSWRRADSLRLRVVGDGDDLADALLGMSHQGRIDLAIFSIDTEAMAHHAFAAMQHVQNDFPEAKFLLLVTNFSDSLLTEVARHGIHGIVLKTASPHVLQLGVETILRGYLLFPPDLVYALRRMPDTETHGLTITFLDERQQKGMPDRQSACLLSQREEQVLHCLVNGYSNKRIGRELAIAEATVKVHVKCLLRKMRVENRTQAAIRARDWIFNTQRPENNFVALQSGKILDTAKYEET